MNTGNVNCTKQMTPDLWDEQINRRCIDEYRAGCQLARIENFCHLGSTDFLRDGKCNSSTLPNEYGNGFYRLCCDACRQGRDAYLKRQPCKRDLPANANEPQQFVKAEFENCCSAKATKGLRSVGDYDEFDEEINACTKFGCEHLCQEIDYDKAVCSCRSGFQLNKDGRSCLDVNECSHPGLNECSPAQVCINLPGSYQCSEIAQPANSTRSDSNETRSLSLRGSPNEMANTKNQECKEGSYFDPHRNFCVGKAIF